MILLAMLASMVSPPQPKNVSDWMSSKDIDENMLPASYKASWLRVIVDQQGRPFDCKVRTSSGVEYIDLFSCSLLVHNGRFKPATDQNGKAVHGVFERAISWDLADHRVLASTAEADLRLEVSRLPLGVENHTQIFAYLVTDAAGNVEDCEASEAAPKNQRSSAATPLLKLACEAATSSWTPALGRSYGFENVRAVQSILVQFDLNRSGD